MADTLLLRFRELTADVETIPAHNAVVDQHRAVWWGWWKKPPELMPDPALTMLTNEVRSANASCPIFFVSSADSSLYQSTLEDVFYEPGGKENGPPDPQLCPDYYRNKKLPAWFKVGRIEPVSTSVLNQYVFSRANRTAFNRTVSALLGSDIGQIVGDTEFLDSNISLWFITALDAIGFAQRTEVIRSLSRGFWPAKGNFLLHLSDLHFGVEHAFRNELGTSYEPRLAKESLSEALLDDLRLLRIKPEDIALVLVTGDLTWTGDSHEFANAEEFLMKLRNACGLHVSQIVVVPGNHDIEWRDSKGEVDPNAELNFTRFSEHLYGSKPEPSLLRIHQFNIANQRFSIIAFNSCRIESRENAGFGFVGKAQLRQALEFLDDQTSESSPRRIALLHHHLLPVNYVEGFAPPDRRVSLTVDAEGVIRSLIGARVPIVLHGHQHQPYIAQIRRVIQDFVPSYSDSSSRGSDRDHSLDGTLTILGGGSMGVSRGHLNTVGRNTYNILDVSRPEQIAVRTRVQSSDGPGFGDYQRFTLTLP